MQLYSFVYILFVAAFAPQWQHKAAMIELTQPAKPGDLALYGKSRLTPVVQVPHLTEGGIEAQRGALHKVARLGADSGQLELSPQDCPQRCLWGGRVKPSAGLSHWAQ